VRTAAHGISIGAPHGWEVRISRTDGALPVLHLATFGLTTGDGAFGAAATGRMRPGDAFAALVEYLPDEHLRPHTGLFAARGLPTLRVSDFSPAQLQVTRPGQLGAQRFFTARERPLCLYAVVWPAARAAPLVGRLAAVLRTLRIE
jgi:hypothetical protein